MPSDSLSDNRPAKRVRSEDAELQPDGADQDTPPTASQDVPVPAGGFVKDEEFWYPDGTLILDIQGTAFRIYMGLLSEKSRVLGDLFQSSPHLTPDGDCNRAQVVRLSDSPHDWRYFLRVLLLKETIFFKTAFDIREDFSMLSALLRLSHKYEVAVVEEYAVAGLKRIYTDDYNTWLSVDCSVCGTWARPGKRKITNLGKTDTRRSQVLSQAIVVINFARLFDIPSILPAAFYHCACLGGAIVRGYTHEDGMTEHLSRDDVVRCINGMQSLTAAICDYVPLLLNHLPEHHTCQKGGACRRLWKDTITDELTGDWQPVFGTLALRGVTEVFPSLSALCDVCKRGAENQIEERRRRVWKDLPGMFHLTHTNKA